jgi:predicted TIM-barrel fold metal-dependent hydrolase
MGTMVDANVHLWDQATSPVFWLSDRTMLEDLLGDYRSLPDRYTLGDYVRATAPFDIGRVIWSDPGTADPVAAIDWCAGRTRMASSPASSRSVIHSRPASPTSSRGSPTTSW